MEDARKDLFRKVSVAADIDGIKGTTHEEWANAYRKVGKHYDVHLSNPGEDWSNEEARTYLSNHQQDSSQ